MASELLNKVIDLSPAFFERLVVELLVKMEVRFMHQALYRVYRPKIFDEIVGQTQVTEVLKNQIIQGTPAHAYLFSGTRGTGKTSCAKILKLCATSI